jgi:hypothetical protein
VRSLLRIAALAVTLIAPTFIALPSGHAAAAEQRAYARGTLSLAIDSVNPQVATANSTVTVRGTISNGTDATVAGLAVQVFSSDTPFAARDSMDAYAADNATTALAPEAIPVTVTGSIRPGGTATWQTSFTAADAGMSAAGFGVYPLQAELIDLDGTVIRTDRTLLPFWPGSNSGVTRLKIAWDWPLIDQPHRQACTALTSNSLAASVAGDGRLDTLLAAAAANPGADLTWLIDPALLGDLDTMTGAYEVGGTADCTGAQAEPASAAAAAWLNSLRTATAGQPVVITPYANVDVAALVHRGLYTDLESACQLGEVTAGQVLHRSFGMNMIFPAGGLADQSVLTTLAATEHVSTAVLASSEMPPQDSAGLSADLSPDDAVTSVRTGLGGTMNILLADNTMTEILKQAGQSTSPAAQFAVEQRFLAETAMIAAEFPNTERSVVISPPETWAPSLSLANDLLVETTTAPWLQPVKLARLAGSHDSYSQLARKPLAADQVSTHELSADYLASAGALSSRLSAYRSMLYQAPTGYTNGLAEALAATESSAWRGPADGPSAADGMTMVRTLGDYLSDAEGKVKIIISKDVPMAGSAGTVPVTIQNGLEQSVRVKLNAIVVTLPGAASQLTVSSPTPVTVLAGQVQLIKLGVRSAPQGSTTIKLSLSSANGTRLPFADTSLTLDSTRYGQAILILIAAAIGLLLLSSVFRSNRRRPQGTDDADSGNVDAGEHHPTEAPDDLADARRWADDT